MMSQIGIGDTYVGSVLPAMVVFGLGLACTVAPITATAMAAAPARHSGLASGVNNAVSRTAQLFAVAALPVLAGISGSDYSDARALESGFQTAMLITAAAAAAGGILAWLTISNDVLAREDHAHAEGGQCTHCAVAGTPLIQESELGDDHAGRELEPVGVASGAEAD
jgi:hypothetical protein